MEPIQVKVFEPLDTGIVEIHMHHGGIISRAKCFYFGTKNKKLVDGLGIPDSKDVW